MYTPISIFYLYVSIKQQVHTVLTPLILIQNHKVYSCPPSI